MDPGPHPLKLLFVCSRSRLRSPTAAKLFEGSQRYRARSAGTSPEAMEGKRVVCLGIPDEFGYMDPDLIDLLLDTLASYVEVP